MFARLPGVSRPPGITVLIYHRVGGGSGSAVDLTVEEFARHIAWLSANTRVLSLDQAAAELTSGRPIEAGVVVTFDDGTADFVEHAVPCLARYQVPATLYVATRFVDEQTHFPWGAPPASWSGLAEAVSTGLVTIGSHSHGHRLFDRSTASDVGEDLDRSIELIGERLGVAVEHFAYPKALAPAATAEAEVRRRFRTAALAGNCSNLARRTDLHRLGRSAVKAGESIGRFERLATGGRRVEGLARDLLGRVRYRGAET